MQRSTARRSAGSFPFATDGYGPFGSYRDDFDDDDESDEDMFDRRVRLRAGPASRPRSATEKKVQETVSRDGRPL